MRLHTLYLIPVFIASLAHAADLKTYLNEYLSGGDHELGHCGVFVETLKDGPGTGIIYHVVGSIGPGPGMKYTADTKTKDVRGSPEYKEGTQIGVVSDSSLGKIESLGQSLPPPKSIFAKDAEGRWKRIVPEPPRYRCRQWATDLVALLKKEGVLKPASGPASPAGGNSPKKRSTLMARSKLIDLLRRDIFADAPRYSFARRDPYHVEGLRNHLAVREANPYDMYYAAEEWQMA